MRRRASISSIALANQTVHVSTEAKASPTMTALTTMSAAMNIPHGERSRGSLRAISDEATGGIAGTGPDGNGVLCDVAGDGDVSGVDCAKRGERRMRLAARTTARYRQQ